MDELEADADDDGEKNEERNWWALIYKCHSLKIDSVF